MAKSKSVEALKRDALKKAVAHQEREGAANIAAAVTATRTGAAFVDVDLALGLVSEVATLSPKRKAKLVEIGRGIRLKLTPATGGDAADLVARLPSDVADASEVAQKLVSLGLRSGRKKVGAAYLEFTGSCDEEAVRAVVEPAGGCVTVIASPVVSRAEADEQNETAVSPPAGDTGATIMSAGEPTGEPDETVLAERPTPDDEAPATTAAAAPEATARNEEDAPVSTVLGPLGVPMAPASPWPAPPSANGAFSPPRLRPAPTMRPTGGWEPRIERDAQDADTKLAEGVE